MIVTSVPDLQTIWSDFTMVKSGDRRSSNRNCKNTHTIFTGSSQNRVTKKGVIVGLSAFIIFFDIVAISLTTHKDRFLKTNSVVND